MDEGFYIRALPSLAERVGLRAITSDQIVPLIVEWLEDEESPFGEGWDLLRQVAPVMEQGDPAEEAVPIARLKVALLDELRGRRLAWVLGDLDGLVEVIADYLRHWDGDPDMTAYGTAVMSEIALAHNQCLRALQDDDPRSRGFAASLLAQMQQRRDLDADEEELLRKALTNERDTVAAVALELALASARNELESNRAVRQLETPGAVAAIWGARYPALPMIVAQAKAEGRRSK
jgi:hypothetical protein